MEVTTMQEVTTVQEKITVVQEEITATRNPEASRQLIRLLVRAREDFQDSRKRMDNRLGRKTDGSAQNIDARTLLPEDVIFFTEIRDVVREQEHVIEKRLKKELKKFPIYTEFLEGVRGVGVAMAAWIISEYDIRIATTVSKLWQFTGLNSGRVRGKKRVEDEKSFSYEETDVLVRGDKKQAGFVSPFNSKLRTVMVGILADEFIKLKSPYALDYYYPYKARLEQSAEPVEEIQKGGKPLLVAWKDAKPAHRDRAAKRYMIKMFLKDLYVAWRTMEGLPVRAPYSEEYLMKKHA